MGFAMMLIVAAVPGRMWIDAGKAPVSPLLAPAKLTGEAR